MRRKFLKDLQEKLNGKTSTVKSIKEAQEDPRSSFASISSEIKNVSTKTSRALKNEIKKVSTKTSRALKNEIKKVSTKTSQALKNEIKNESTKTSRALKNEIKNESTKTSRALKNEIKNESTKTSRALKNEIKNESPKTSRTLKNETHLTKEKSSFTSISSAIRNVATVTALTVLPGMGTAVDVMSLPVTVYLYTSPSDSRVSSTYSINQVYDLFDAVNDTWKKCGIRWDVVSIEHKEIPLLYDKDFLASSDRGEFRQKLLAISPNHTREKMWSVIIVRSFPVLGAGVYLPETKTIFYSETSRGGDTRAVNLAHELGHSLGLVHDSEMANLMHPRHGARDNAEIDTVVIADQIAAARAQAEIGPMDIVQAQALQASNEQTQPGNQQMQQPVSRDQRKDRIVKRLQQFDYDNNGEILFEDIPSSQGQKVFKKIDTNDDGKIDWQELDSFNPNK